MSDDRASSVVIGYRKQTTKVVKKDADLNTARQSGAVIATDRKPAGNKAQSTDHQRIAKLDRENEVAPPVKILPSVGRAIQDGRMAQNLTQEGVAKLVNEKPSVIKDYESGKAIPNTQVLSKLERVLKVKLRGAEIGKKLETAKK